MKKLISGLTVATLTVLTTLSTGAIAFAAPADPVVFADANFEACVGAQIPGWTVGTPITEGEMATITNVGYCPNVSSLDGAQYLTSIDTISFGGTWTTLAPLQNLTTPTRITAAGDGTNIARDFSPVLSIPTLTHLGLTNGVVNDSNISSLSGMTNLANLSLYSNNLTDITALSGLNSTFIDLSYNSITDFSSLGGNTFGVIQRGQTIDLQSSPINAGDSITLTLKDMNGDTPTVFSSTPNPVSYVGSTLTFPDTGAVSTEFYEVMFGGDWFYLGNEMTVRLFENVLPVLPPFTTSIGGSTTIPSNPATMTQLSNTNALVSTIMTTSNTTTSGAGMSVNTYNTDGSLYGSTFASSMGNGQFYAQSYKKPTIVKETIGGDPTQGFCPTGFPVPRAELLAACANFPGITATTYWLFAKWDGTVSYNGFQPDGTPFTSQAYTIDSFVLYPSTTYLNHPPYEADPYCVINSFSKTGNDITVDFTINSIADDMGEGDSGGASDITYSGPQMLAPANADNIINMATGGTVPIAAGNTIQITDMTTGGILYANSLEDDTIGQTFGDNLWYRASLFPSWNYDGTNGTSYLDPNNNTKRIFKGTTNMTYTFADDVIGSATDRVMTVAVSGYSVSGWFKRVSSLDFSPEGFYNTGAACSFTIPGNAAPTPTPTPVPDETKNGGTDTLPYIIFGGLLVLGIAGMTIMVIRKRKEN